MSLLWKNAAAFQREAMAWHVEPGEERYAQSAKHVKKAGFAGYVNYDQDTREELGEHEDDHEGFDEDLYDQAHENVVQPRDEAYHEEHDDYPQSYYDRKDDEYGRLVDQKGRENEPDHEDNHLMRFVSDHGTNSAHWQTHGSYGAVDLTQPVYATQSHVSQDHIDKYLYDPGAMSHHRMKYQNAGGSDYLGDGAPMFVTHHGRLHTTEGHHRTAAALQRGDKSIMGWHYDADKHGFPDENGYMPGHPDYEDPDEW